MSATSTPSVLAGMRWFSESGFQMFVDTQRLQLVQELLAEMRSEHSGYGVLVSGPGGELTSHSRVCACDPYTLRS